MPLQPINRHLAQLVTDYRNQNGLTNFRDARLEQVWRDTQAMAEVLLRLVASYPRPVNAWSLLEPDRIVLAVSVLKELRLIRLRHSFYWFLTRQGEALIPQIVSQVTSIH